MFVHSSHVHPNVRSCTICESVRSRSKSTPKGARRVSLARLGLRFRKEHGKRRDHDNTPFIKHTVAHREGADDPDPYLAHLLRQVDQWLSKLGVETQSSVKFLHC